MKLTNKKSLQALQLFAAKSDVRYYLNGVLATPDKLTATDGHKLIQIPYLELSPDAYPGLDDREESDSPESIISNDTIAGAVKNAKKHTLPVLDETVAIRDFGDKIELSSTDTDNTQSVQGRKIDGRYPELKNMYATDDKKAVTVRMGYPQLIALGNAIRILGAQGAALTVNGNGGMVTFKIEVKDQGEPVTGILMPMQV